MTTIEEIKARCEAATPGPWAMRNEPKGSGFYGTIHGTAGISFSGTRADNEFIAASRQDIPYLLDLIEAQAAEIAELQARVADLEGQLEESETGRQAADNTNSWNASRADELEAQISVYIADRGFEQWRRPQEAGEGERDG